SSRLRGLAAAALAGVCVLAGACDTASRREAAQEGPLRVAAAVSLTDVLTGVGRRWDAAGNPNVEFNFAASNVLARQILEGAPVDVFISADEEHMERVSAGGRRD